MCPKIRAQGFPLKTEGMEEPQEKERGSELGAVKPEAVNGGKVQEVSLQWVVLGVTRRGGNCNGCNSPGKKPNASNQSCNFSGHLICGFCSPVSSLCSATGKLGCWTCLSPVSAALSSSCPSLS